MDTRELESRFLPCESSVFPVGRCTRYLVEPEGIQPSSQVCKTRILALYYGPVSRPPQSRPASRWRPKRFLLLGSRAYLVSIHLPGSRRNHLLGVRGQNG